jgi:hypothetical protein
MTDEPMAAEVLRQQRINDSQQIGFDLEKYIKNKRHHAGCPSFLSFRELDILMCITPGPLGLGMDNMKTGRLLKINRKTVYRILKGLKKKFPVAMDRLASMRNTMNRQRRGLIDVRSFENMVVREEKYAFIEELEDCSPGRISYLDRTGSAAGIKKKDKF